MMITKGDRKPPPPSEIVIYWDESEPSLGAGWAYRLYWETPDGEERHEESGSLDAAEDMDEDIAPVDLLAAAAKELSGWGVTLDGFRLSAGAAARPYVYSFVPR